MYTPQRYFQAIQWWYLQQMSISNGALSPLLPLEDLVAYWKLDETSGTRFDSANSNNLSDNNTVGSASGKIGNAADFVAANSEYLEASGVGAFGDTPFTVTGWFYLDAATGFQTIVSRYTTDTNDREWLLRVDSGVPTFFVNNDGIGAPDGVVSASAVSAGAWHFVVAWHDSVGNTINIQVDNGTVNSAAYSLGVYANSSKALYIGTTSPSVGFMDGRIDEIGLWGRLLTSAERTILYNSDSGLTYPFV
jgi:hypothetical protein